MPFYSLIAGVKQLPPLWAFFLSLLLSFTPTLCVIVMDVIVPLAIFMRFVQLTKYILSRKAFSIMYNSLRRIYFPPSLSSIMAYNTILSVILSIFILTLQYCVKMQQIKSDADRGGRSIEVCTC